MITKWIKVLIFWAIGIFCFMMVVTIRPVMLSPLNQTLSTQSATMQIDMFNPTVGVLFSFYDIAAWMFIIAPAVFTAIQVLKKEPESQVYEGGFV